MQPIGWRPGEAGKVAGGRNLALQDLMADIELWRGALAQGSLGMRPSMRGQAEHGEQSQEGQRPY